MQHLLVSPIIDLVQVYSQFEASGLDILSILHIISKALTEEAITKENKEKERLESKEEKILKELEKKMQEEREDKMEYWVRMT